MSWGWLILRRTAGALVALAVLSVLVFVATEVLPGDAVSMASSVDTTEAQRRELAAALGLDRPPVERYLDWAGGAVRGDLGTGTVGGRDVTGVLISRLPNSLLLTSLALLLAVPVAIALGLFAGLRAGHRRDRAVSTSALVVVALPEFLIAVLLILVFATGLGLLPRVSLVPIDGHPGQTPEILVLPVLCLSALITAIGVRLIRSTVADVATTPYVEAARLAGVRGGRLALRHVLPNALAPAVQLFAIMFGGMVGGAVVVETVFNYPGVGYELQQAVANRDVPMVQGLTLALCAATLAVLLVADLLNLALNPRARSAT